MKKLLIFITPILFLTNSVLGCGATADLSGRVTANGRGVARAIVMIEVMDDGGQQLPCGPWQECAQTRMTNLFGYYRFESGIGPCAVIYRLQVTDKRREFDPVHFFYDGSGSSVEINVEPTGFEFWIVR